MNAFWIKNSNKKSSNGFAQLMQVFLAWWFTKINQSIENACVTQSVYENIARRSDVSRQREIY